MRFIHLDQPPLPKLIQHNSIIKKRCYETPEGNKFPSVTTILSYGEKIWLNEWRAMLGNTKADKEQKRCADRGTAIHKLAECYLNNQENFVKGYKPEYIAGFNQIKMYLNKINNIHFQEAQLYSDELKVAGTVDCIGDYENVLSIIDFKTSNNNKTSQMVEDYRLQCTAYSLCYLEQTGIFVDQFVILIMVERGLVPLVFKGSVIPYIGPLKQRIQKYVNDKINK